MATSWGHHPEEDPNAQRPRLGYRASTLVATLAGAAGEAAIRVTEPGAHVSRAWHEGRLPFLAALALAVAQVPLARRRRPRTIRPDVSELARHLAQRTREGD